MTTEITQALERLLEEGISLIATKVDKKPCCDWTKRDKLTGIELLDDLFKYKTECVAVRLGVQSENLMCLDLDEKHHIGFSKRFFDEFKEFFPELWERVRVERTPSGGFHIFYRLLLSEGQVCPPSKYVGYRALTEIEQRPYVIENEQLKLDGKKTKFVPVKTCFLEIRGDGGLCQTAPSIGYSLVKGEGLEIAKISLEEHFSIETFCYGFNEFIVKEKEVVLKKADINFYSTNPFEDFDNSERAGLVLKEEGWIYRKSSDGKDWYSKPNRKDGDKDVDAWFNHDKNFYNVFSTNCGLDAKGYSPSNMLSQLKFSGDKQKTYQWLVYEGFGKIEPKEEAKIVKNSLSTGTELPRNISEEAKQIYVEEKEKRDTNFPFGIFWEENDDAVKINFESILIVLRGLGFKIYNGGLIRVNFGRVERVDVKFLLISLKDYIQSEDVNILDAYERFVHTYSKSIILRLDELPKENILKSTKSISYKFFQNCYVRIEKEFCEVLSYDTIEDGKLILDESISKRNFELLQESGLKKYEGSIFYDYLTHAITSTIEGTVDSYLMKIVGFLTHDFKDQESYFVLGIESCEESKFGGGSGKNVFFSTLGQSVTLKSTAASQIKTDTSFLQSWNNERVFVLSDMPRKFDLIPFKDLITDGAVVKKLYKDEYTIPVEDSAKLCGTSNYSPDITDPGLARRVRQIEFTEFFTKTGGVREFYGKMFCKDWNDEDFHYFDNFIIECIQVYLLFNGKIDKNELSAGGWAKQFDQKFTHRREFIVENISNWSKVGFINNDDFNKVYDEYCRANKIIKGTSMYVMNQALEDYCLHFNIKFNKAASKRKDSVTVERGKSFGDVPEEKDDMPF